MKERVIKTKVRVINNSQPLTLKNISLLKGDEAISSECKILDARLIVLVPEKKVTITESEFMSVMNNANGKIDVGGMSYLQEQFGFNE